MYYRLYIKYKTYGLICQLLTIHKEYDYAKYTINKNEYGNYIDNLMNIWYCKRTKLVKRFITWFVS